MASINRQKSRFMEALSGNRKIVFIRSEEPASYPDLGNRMSFPDCQDEYSQDEYSQDEYAHLKRFSTTLKAKYPECKFEILFLSDKGCFADNENNIIGIDGCDVDYRDPFISSKMVTFINKHKDFILKNMDFPILL